MTEAAAKPAKETNSKTSKLDESTIDHSKNLPKSPEEIRLGETRIDFASGFSGLVVARVDSMSGNVQFCLQPRGGGENLPDAHFVDYHLLSKVDDGIADKLPKIDESAVIRLGEEVQDVISGVKGIVIERFTFQNGCVYFSVQPKADKKTPNLLPEAVRYPHKRLKVIGRGLTPKVEKKAVEEAPKRAAPGGPSRNMKSMRLA